MKISDSIEKFILELLKDEQNWIEINRREIADIFHCVPSNINYVMETRFCPSQGYIVESRRGGGGYIRIRRINSGDDVIQIINNIGDSIDCNRAKSIIKYFADTERITSRESEIMYSAVSDKSFEKAEKNNADFLRAAVLKNMIAAAEL